jgi:hypothetical protein
VLERDHVEDVNGGRLVVGVGASTVLRSCGWDAWALRRISTILAAVEGGAPGDR